MVALLFNLIKTLRSALRTRAELALENLALRQQLANLRRTSGRPRLRRIDRAFWLALSRLWSRWADVLVIVKPDTVVRWHRTVDPKQGIRSTHGQGRDFCDHIRL